MYSVFDILETKFTYKRLYITDIKAIKLSLRELKNGHIKSNKIFRKKEQKARKI